MKTCRTSTETNLIAGAIAVSPLSAPVLMTSTFTAGVAQAGVISDANAAPDSGQGQ